MDRVEERGAVVVTGASPGIGAAVGARWPGKPFAGVTGELSHHPGG